MHKNDEETTWFGVTRDDTAFHSFRDYGRYAEIMIETLDFSPHRSSPWAPDVRDHRFPSLVPFVGQTGERRLGISVSCSRTKGAGKSTNIKMVIELRTTNTECLPSHVIRSAGVDVPTSGDVHFRSDPHTATSNSPFLYTDCEGLQGGEKEPLGARLRRNDKSAKFGRTGASKKIEKIQHTSERELTWAETHVKRNKKHAVTNLCPRLLYTFSDIVVFVLENPRCAPLRG